MNTGAMNRLRLIAVSATPWIERTFPPRAANRRSTAGPKLIATAVNIAAMCRNLKIVTGAIRSSSAARDRRDHVDLRSGGHDRIERSPASGDEHVDVGPDDGTGVDDAVPEPGNAAIQLVDHLGDGRAVDLEPSWRIGEQGEERAGQVDGHRRGGLGHGSSISRRPRLR